MLKELSYDIGPRLAGSPRAAAAVEWSRQTMLKLGFENVHLQPVRVPHWERGKIEEAAVINSITMGTTLKSQSGMACKLNFNAAQQLLLKIFRQNIQACAGQHH